MVDFQKYRNKIMNSDNLYRSLDLLNEAIILAIPDWYNRHRILRKLELNLVIPADVDNFLKVNIQYPNKDLTNDKIIGYLNEVEEIVCKNTIYGIKVNNQVDQLKNLDLRGLAENSIGSITVAIHNNQQIILGKLTNTIIHKIYYRKDEVKDRVYSLLYRLFSCSNEDEMLIELNNVLKSINMSELSKVGDFYNNIDIYEFMDKLIGYFKLEIYYARD